jgi:hypothetical protein
MSGQKKGFAAFVRPVSDATGAATPESGGRAGRQASDGGRGDGQGGVPSNHRCKDRDVQDDGRVRTVTSTGRVRTFSASRLLPGITLRVTEERWERLKMMSIQERRPLQEIVSEAMEQYMRERGLPW